MTRADSASDNSGLTVLSLAAFTSMAAMRVCDPLLPAFAETYTVSTGEAAKTISLFAVSYGLLQLVYGPLGDRFGKLRVVTFAVFGCVLGNALAAASGSLNALLVARMLSGAMAAGIIPLALAWVGDAVAYERRQEVLARLLMATLMGTAFGQWMAGLIADIAGWRWVFVLMAAMFFGVGVRAVFMLRMRAGNGGAVAAPPTAGFSQSVRQVLSTSWARTILLVTLIEGVFAFSALAFVAAHLHHEFDLSLNAAGGIAALFALGGLGYAAGARRMLARYAETGLVIGGVVLLGLAFVLLAISRTWMLAIPAAPMAGLGFSMLHGTLQTHATQMAPAARGTAVSLFVVSLFFGQSLGVFIASIAVDRLGFRVVFAISALAISALGWVFARALSARAATGSAEGT